MIFCHKRYFCCRIPENCCCKKERKIDYEYYKRLSRQYEITTTDSKYETAQTRNIFYIDLNNYEDYKNSDNYDPNNLFIITP